MPELPEVERLRLSLLPHLCDAEVLSARLKRRDFCTTFANEKGRRPAPIPEMLLEGAEVRGLVRKGKQLAVVAKDGRTLLIHLGMSGQVLFISGAQTPRAKHQHVEWRIRRTDGVEGALVFRDPRGLVVCGPIRALSSWRPRRGVHWGLTGTPVRWMSCGKQSVACAGVEKDRRAGRSSRRSWIRRWWRAWGTSMRMSRCFGWASSRRGGAAMSCRKRWIGWLVRCAGF